ncbi:hypothetical protein DVH24_002973 [Malus domestica]|uniref:Trichome birefringence-like C-terminal domain-containing protein n=1 Tax=Malus domestica TaxID=3750 RepID=A0A498KAM9_MALDO|nr:hypothetical protein DVH24_002973 [Malus domestica]
MVLGLGRVLKLDLIGGGKLQRDVDMLVFKTWHWFNCRGPSQPGSERQEPRARSCVGQKVPLLGSTYPGGLPPALSVLKNVLSTIKKPVTLLDITNLSLLRKDGHPSIYGLGGRTGMDCSHCLIGVFVESQILGMRFSTILFFETLIIEYHKKDGVI